MNPVHCAYLYSIVHRLIDVSPSGRDNASDEASLRVESVHQLHRFFVPSEVSVGAVFSRASPDLHGENNATAENKSTQSRKSARPKGEDTFMLEDLDHTVQAILVRAASFYRLHACLDGVDGHGCVDGDDSGETSEAKCAHSAELLPGGDVGLCKLLERGIARETDSRVGSLAGSGRDKALEEAANALLLRNDSGTVEEPTHTRVGRLSVVDARKSVRRKCLQA